MTVSDYATVAGLFLASWAGGYASGMFFKAVRSVLERATGAGSL